MPCFSLAVASLLLQDEFVRWGIVWLYSIKQVRASKRQRAQHGQAQAGIAPHRTLQPGVTRCSSVRLLRTCRPHPPTGLFPIPSPPAPDNRLCSRAGPGCCRPSGRGGAGCVHHLPQATPAGGLQDAAPAGPGRAARPASCGAPGAGAALRQPACACAHSNHGFATRLGRRGGPLGPLGPCAGRHAKPAGLVH